MNKRSNRNHTDETKVNEPWDQPIYDTESSEMHSRSSQHRQKRGSTLFLSIVLFVLFLCVAIPTIAGIWVYHQKNEAAATISSSTEVAKKSSTVQSTKATKTSETATTESVVSSEAEEANEVTSTSSSSSVPAASTTPSTSTAPAAAGTTVTVLAGEGPNQIAARAGISVEKLLSLNGMTMSNYFFSPGQEVKIK